MRWLLSNLSWIAPTVLALISLIWQYYDKVYQKPTEVLQLDENLSNLSSKLSELTESIKKVDYTLKVIDHNQMSPRSPINQLPNHPFMPFTRD